MKELDLREVKVQHWMDEYGDALLRICTIYLSDFEQAKDAVQDTFLKAWRCMDQFEGRGGSSEKTWLTAIAINTCRSYKRTRWFRHMDTSRGMESLPERICSAQPEDRDLLMDVIKLPDQLKTVILLYYYHGMTQEEIASILHMSRSQISHRLRKALDALRLTYGEEDLR